MFRFCADYGQVTLIKANWVEATEAAGKSDTRPLALARSLADCHGGHIVVTLGGHGMVCAEREGRAWYLPAESEQVRDVCGAGDTVLASLGVEIAAGESLDNACRVSVRMAADQVARMGVCAVA